MISLVVDKTPPRFCVLPLSKEESRCLRPPPFLFDNRLLLLNNAGSKRVSPLRLQRTVPTKYKGFCARLGPREKSRSL